MVPYFSCFPGLTTEPPAPWEADAITILELLDWPSSSMLPLSEASCRGSLCDYSLERLAFRKTRKSALHPHIHNLLSGICLGIISGSTIIFTHIHKHILKYRNSTADKCTYSFKEGRRKVAIQGSLSAPFASARWGPA